MVPGALAKKIQIPAKGLQTRGDGCGLSTIGKSFNLPVRRAVFDGKAITGVTATLDLIQQLCIAGMQPIQDAPYFLTHGRHDIALAGTICTAFVKNQSIINQSSGIDGKGRAEPGPQAARMHIGTVGEIQYCHSRVYLGGLLPGTCF